MGQKAGRTIFALFVGCVLAVATFAVARMIDQNRDATAVKKAQADLEHQEELARRAGIHLTETELIPQIPAKENAATLYAKAGELDKQIGQSKALNDALLLTSISDSASAETAEAGLKAAKPMMDVVAAAAKLPGFVFEKHGLPTPFDFPTLAQFKLYAKVATLEARFKTYQGQPVAALESITTYAPIANHLGQSPTDIAMLVQVAIEAIFTKEIAGILAKHGQEPGVAEAVQTALSALGPTPNLARVAEGENIYAQTVSFNDLVPKKGEKPNFDGMDKDVRRVAALASKPGMINEWRATQIEYTRNLVGIYQQSEKNWTKLGETADAMIDKMTASSDDSLAFLRMENGFRQSSAIDAVARQLSTQRVLAQSAAIFSTWNLSGQLPASLPLPGDALQDPRSSGNLHYSYTATGFKVYAVGDHGIDHGGKARTASNAAESDIVFEYPIK